MVCVVYQGCDVVWAADILVMNFSFFVEVFYGEVIASYEEIFFVEIVNGAEGNENATAFWDCVNDGDEENDASDSWSEICHIRSPRWLSYYMLMQWPLNSSALTPSYGYQ